MDILFLLKCEQEALLAQTAAFAQELAAHPDSLQASFARLTGKLLQYLALDEEFLYPEVGDLFLHAAKAVLYGKARHAEIRAGLARLETLLKSSQVPAAECVEAFAELEKAVQQHVFYQQEQLIPRMREMIPTQDREDLAEVFTDIKEDFERRRPLASGSGEAVL